MTPLDRLLAPVDTVLTRAERVRQASGDYEALQVVGNFETQRWDALTQLNTLHQLRQLANAHPTDGLNLGRGVHDDFASTNYYTSAFGVAVEGTGPLNSAASHLSQGLARWLPDGTGTLKYRAIANSSDVSRFGAWEIGSGALVSGGGTLYVPVPKTTLDPSRYAMRFTCKLTVAGVFYNLFVGLTTAHSSVSNALVGMLAGFLLPGTWGSRHDVTRRTGAGDVAFQGPLAETKTFTFAVTFNPSRGVHITMRSADPADDVEVYDPTPLAIYPTVFVVTAKGAAAVNTEAVIVDYMGYSLVDLESADAVVTASAFMGLERVVGFAPRLFVHADTVAGSIGAPPTDYGAVSKANVSQPAPPVIGAGWDGDRSLDFTGNKMLRVDAFAQSINGGYADGPITTIAAVILPAGVGWKALFDVRSSAFPAVRYLSAYVGPTPTNLLQVWGQGATSAGSGSTSAPPIGERIIIGITRRPSSWDVCVLSNSGATTLVNGGSFVNGAGAVSGDLATLFAEFNGNVAGSFFNGVAKMQVLFSGQDVSITTLQAAMVYARDYMNCRLNVSGAGAFTFGAGGGFGYPWS